MLCALSRDYYASISLPSIAEVREIKNFIKENYAALEDLCSIAEGLKLLFVIQNMFYNGWTHDHYVSNISIFAPNGIVIIFALNAPGSRHDSAIAEGGDVYKKLHYIYEETDSRCVVDSAFSKGDHSFLIKVVT